MGDALRKRKLVAAEAWKTYRLARGQKFSLERRRAAADLTTDMLARRAPTHTCTGSDTASSKVTVSGAMGAFLEGLTTKGRCQPA